MGYYAAFIDVTDRPCVVVGGAGPAEEKVRGLLESEAQVVVVAEKLGSGLEALASAGVIEWRARGFVSDDLDGAVLVVDASLDEPTAAVVFEAGRRRGVLVNVLDRPGQCDFIAPAVVRRGPLQLAVSTAGRTPYMAGHIRRMLERWVGPEWGELVELVGQLRDRMRADGVPLSVQNVAYERVTDSGALEFLREGRRVEAAAAIAACADGDPAPVLRVLP